MATGLDFTGMVPGIDFLQSLVKSASSAAPNIPGLGAVPGMGQWVMPTLDPAELEKRISELRTVHFWLEQNAKLLEGTIQAMEVQRMTLSTLHSLNLPMADLRSALSIKPPPAPTPRPEPEPEPEPEPAAEPEQSSAADAEADAGSPSFVPPVDPVKWWGALTQQFTEIAGQAMRASAAEAAAAVAKTPPAPAAAGKRPRRKATTKTSAAQRPATQKKTAAKTRTR